MSAAPPSPGRLGRYVVQRELGRGAMGVVYLARDEELQRTVAVKCVALDGGERERDLQEGRFRQEARAAGGLSHPAIITIFDVGREKDTAYIAMELLEGRELRELIRAGEVTPVRALEIAIAAAEALAFAHDRGVVHRDVKPGNIMVLEDGRIKLMDFGIARLQEPSVKTQTGVLLGSPQYMAPEQVAGQSIDGRADQFSLGVVLYEMLTGVKPFDAADLTQVLFWVVNMPAKPPSERRPELPAVLDFIVGRAMRKKPEERYASARELAEELRKALPEVAQAQRQHEERRALEGSTSQRTVPLAEIAPDATTVPLAQDERIELRPSRRFDNSEALARLSVVPLDSGTRSRGGWTVPAPAPRRRRFDRAAAVLVASWGAALLVAVAIVVM